MTVRRAWVAGLAVLGLLALAPRGQAAIILTNPNQFSGNEQLVTFQGINPFEIITPDKALGVIFQYAVTGAGVQAASDGLTPREFGPSEAAVLNQFQVGTAGIEITFPLDVDRVGFEFRPNPNLGGVLTISLFEGTTSVESFTIPNRAPPLPATTYLFYGFETTQPFDRLVLVGPGDGRFALDNLRFEQAGVAAIPEPSSLALLGIGAAGLAIGRWRGKRGAAEPFDGLGNQ